MTWQDLEESVEVLLHLPDNCRGKDLSVSLRRSELLVRHGTAVLLQGRTLHDVSGKPEDLEWFLEERQGKRFLVLEMLKKSPEGWNRLFESDEMLKGKRMTTDESKVKWGQGIKEVFATLALPIGSDPSDVSCTFKTQLVSVELKGQAFWKQRLAGEIFTENNKWTVQNGEVKITMKKQNSSLWKFYE